MIAKVVGPAIQRTETGEQRLLHVAARLINLYNSLLPSARSSINNYNSGQFRQLNLLCSKVC
jgi:hypothetical protein